MIRLTALDLQALGAGVVVGTLLAIYLHRRTGWVRHRPARAERLLADVLGPTGYAAWQRDGFVMIQNPTNPDLVYRIDGDTVRRATTGPYKSRLCLKCPGGYPEADRVLAYVLALRYRERQIHREASWIT